MNVTRFNGVTSADFRRVQAQQPGSVLPDRIQISGENITIRVDDGDIVLTTTVCGFPGFCAQNAYNDCLNTTLLNCGKCGGARAALFGFITILLSLMIFGGNAIVLLVANHRRKKHNLAKLDICRSSLATADLLSGQ